MADMLSQQLLEAAKLVEEQVSSISSTHIVPQPIQQCLKSAPQEDLFYVTMLRYVSCFPSCQVGFFNVEYQLFGD